MEKLWNYGFLNGINLFETLYEPDVNYNNASFWICEIPLGVCEVAEMLKPFPQSLTIKNDELTLIVNIIVHCGES